MEKDNKNTKRKIIVILLIILILLYFLIQYTGYIENRGPAVPTGNVDIFEITCNCGMCANNKPSNESSDGINKDKSEISDLIVYDRHKVWDNKELRIFSNPAYQYESIIAPGSTNSYTYVIRNNNYFDMIVDISFVEENDKDINMKYKVQSQGKYVIGAEDQLVEINNKKIEKVRIPAKSQIPYILEWKWVDSDNDTKIGFDINSNYKLSINIGANEAL